MLVYIKEKLQLSPITKHNKKKRQKMSLFVFLWLFIDNRCVLLKFRVYGTASFLFP